LLELSMHIMDIVENSVKAGASHISISVIETNERDEMQLLIEDNGTGMDESMLKRAQDPFVTTKQGKKVGLGLSMLSEAARKSGGEMRVSAIRGKGTVVEANFGLTHVDRQPLGDMVESLMVLLIGNPDVEFTYHHQKDDVVFHWSTMELPNHLRDLPRCSARVMEFIRAKLQNGLNKFKPNFMNK
jgi:hypothetical protein